MSHSHRIPLLSTAAVTAAGAASVLALHPWTARADGGSARATPFPDTKVIVTTIGRPHGEPADGTKVTVSGGDHRDFVNAEDGFTLVSIRGELTPARTTNGGRTWEVDGPGIFTEGAADAAATVEAFDATSPSTFYAYGGGQVVDITSDGGAVWRQVVFQGLEAGVSPVDHGLAAYVDESNSTGSQEATVQFYTTNGGRSWRVVKGEAF